MGFHQLENEIGLFISCEVEFWFLKLETNFILCRSKHVRGMNIVLEIGTFSPIIEMLNMDFDKATAKIVRVCWFCSQNCELVVFIWMKSALKRNL